jgi:hypothetical protein
VGREPKLNLRSVPLAANANADADADAWSAYNMQRACVRARACRAFTCGERCVPCDLFAFAFAWLQDIGALEAVRAEIEGAVLEPIRRPERFEALGLAAPAGVLLYAVPCNATPMPCNAMPCRAVPCLARAFISFKLSRFRCMPCHAMPCHAMQCHAMPSKRALVGVQHAARDLSTAPAVRCTDRLPVPTI